MKLSLSPMDGRGHFILFPARSGTMPQVLLRALPFVAAERCVVRCEPTEVFLRPHRRAGRKLCRASQPSAAVAFSRTGDPHGRFRRCKSIKRSAGSGRSKYIVKEARCGGRIDGDAPTSRHCHAIDAKKVFEIMRHDGGRFRQISSGMRTLCLTG